MADVVINVSVAEDNYTVTADEVIHISISEDNYTVSLAAASATNTASSISNTTHGTITATNVQEAIEQLADQFYRSSSTPSGSNLGEGDIWYDTANEQLKVYREISSGTFAWIALVSGGYITGEESLMDKLDGGLF